MRDRFYTFHPLVNLIYFVSVVGVLMICTSPALIVAGLAGGILYVTVQKGLRYTLRSLFFLSFIVLAITAVNPFFNHRGITSLYTLKSGNKITLEAIFFGFISGLRLSAVVLWLGAFTNIFTSDKHMYIFGRIIPGTSLVISMVLSFIPRFIKTFRENYGALRIMYGSGLKCAVKSTSGTVTWSFESSVHTSGSMRARGYGKGKRSMYNRYRATLKDYIFALFDICLTSIIVYGQVASYLDYIYYPVRMYERDGFVRWYCIGAFVCLVLSVSFLALDFGRKETYECS